MALVQPQYATLAELQALSITPAVYQRFATQANGTGTMTSALQAASSLADGYLASQFTLPLITSPQGWGMDLKRCVCDIAAYELYNIYGFAPGAAPGDDMIKVRYANAMDWLTRIADNKIHPQFVDSSTSNSATDPEAGPYIISDSVVGFTSRGRNASSVCLGDLFNGGW